MIMMKKFVLSLIISCGAMAATALPNVNNLRDTIDDNDIVAPFSLETHEKMADSLAKEWYYQQYVTLSTHKEEGVSSRSKSQTPSDELYIQRLQYLQNEGGFTIEMPYNNVVKKYIEMYTSSRRRNLVEKMLGLWLYYEPIFEEALLKEGIPMELKYLPIIESALNPNAVSPAAAAGLWQFIPSTGKGMGLEINSTVDERRDTYKASQKAAEFLHQLYNTYGDWSLVIAAYNCGPGNVNKAIRRAGGGKKDYWEIYNYLPKETRGYVPAFIAAAYVMNFHNEHGISTAIAKKPIVTDTVDVRRRINFKQIADVINIDIDAIEALNPQYLKNTIPAGPTKPYKLILPSKYCYMYVSCEDIIGSKDAHKYKSRERAEPGKKREDPKPEAPKTEENNEQAKPQQSYASNNSQTEESNSSSNASYTSKEDVVMHEVKSGETLKSIANKYGTNTSRIKKDNNLTSNTVSRGQVLKITTYKKVLNDDANNMASTTTKKSTKSSNPVSTTTNSYKAKNNYSQNTNNYNTDNSTTYTKKKSSKKKKTYTPKQNTQNTQQAQQTTPSYKSSKKKSSTKSVAKVSNNQKGQKQVAQKSKKNNKKDVASTSKSKSKSSSKDVKSSKSKSKKSTSIGKTSKSKSKTASKTSSKKDKKSTTSKSSSSKDKKKSTTSKSSSSKKTTKATDKKKSSSTKAKATDKKKSTTSNKKATTKSSSSSNKKSAASKSKSSSSKKSTASKSSSSKKSSKKKK